MDCFATEVQLLLIVVDIVRILVSIFCLSCSV